MNAHYATKAINGTWGGGGTLIKHRIVQDCFDDSDYSSSLCSQLRDSRVI